MPFAQGHALLIGVGSYMHAPQQNIPMTADDAASVAAVLHDPRYCGYPPEQVVQLVHATASRNDILILCWPWCIQQAMS